MVSESYTWNPINGFQVLVTTGLQKALIHSERTLNVCDTHYKHISPLGMFTASPYTLGIKLNSQNKQSDKKSEPNNTRKPITFPRIKPDGHAMPDIPLPKHNTRGLNVRHTYIPPTCITRVYIAFDKEANHTIFH